MPDLPDWFTQVGMLEAEAYKFRGGADTSKSATPVARDIYLATDTKKLYICVADGVWTGFDVSILIQGILTLYANMVAGGYRITGLGAPTTQDDALRYGRAEIRNAEIASAAAIAYSKLALTGGIVNADIAAAAAIAYSKLNLSLGIVNADIAAAAAIAYSKLNLSLGIVNADIAAAAAIAASKLDLTNPTIQGTVSAGTGLTMPAFTAGGNISLGAYSLKTTNTLLKEGSTTEIYARNVADSAYVGFEGTHINLTSRLYLSTTGVAIKGANSDSAYNDFQARKAGVGQVEVARLQAAADPYFQATLPMVLKPIATASLPGTPVEGMLAYDATLDKLTYRDASAWQVLTPIASGLIVMWHGLIANIPSGWVICDGNNGTPNLLAKFVEGVATAATNPGTTGGATAKATAGHAHEEAMSNQDADASQYGNEGAPPFGEGTAVTATIQYTRSVGSYASKRNLTESKTDSIADIRPLFYDIAFIMKT